MSNHNCAQVLDQYHSANATSTKSSKSLSTRPSLNQPDRNNPDGPKHHAARSPSEEQKIIINSPTTSATSSPTPMLNHVVLIKEWSWVALMIVGVVNFIVLISLFIYLCVVNNARNKERGGMKSGLNKSKGIRNCFGMFGGSKEDAEKQHDDDDA